MTLSQLRDALLALELPDVDLTVRPGVVILERGRLRVQARVQVAVPGERVAVWCLMWAGGASEPRRWSGRWCWRFGGEDASAMMPRWTGEGARDTAEARPYYLVMYSPAGL